MENIQIWDFAKTISTVIITIVGTKIVSSFFENKKVKNETIEQITRDFIKIVNPKNLDQIKFRLKTNKIEGSDMKDIEIIYEKYSNLSPGISKKYLKVDKFIKCLSEILGIIKAHYKVDTRYPDTYTIIVDYDNPQNEWKILEELEIKLTELFNEGTKLYEKIITRHPKTLKLFLESNSN